MSATVNISELNPETRARVLKQIEGTDAGSQNVHLTGQNPPSHTPAEMRARSILSRMDSLSAKLKTLEDDIRALWLDFDNLKAGETILGCATKKEFCERKLHRNPRTIQYMLAGGNPDNVKRSEIISLPPTLEPASPRTQQTVDEVKDISDVIASVRQRDWQDELLKKLSPLMPIGSDGQPCLAALIEQAKAVGDGDFDTTKMRAAINMLNEISKHFAASAKALEARIQFARVA